MLDDPCKKVRVFEEGCGSGRSTATGDDLTLDTIVRDYIAIYRERGLQENNFYKNQPNLDKAIEAAAMCKLSSGKRHSHQRRIPIAVLHQAKSSLRLVKGELEACKDFFDLMEVTNRRLETIKGLGDLTIYDITHRIGLFLGIRPTGVYLHAGTREGASALGIGRQKKTARMVDLPKAFHVLEPSEVEDCLCIYKGEIKMVSGR
jgi:hypothetical protein